MARNIPDKLKLEVLGKIYVGIPLRELVDEYNIAYPTLLSWRKELREAIDNGKITDLVNVDEVIIESVAQATAGQLVELAPEQQEVIENKVNEVVDGAKGLQLLDTKLQAAALQATSRLQDLIEQTTSPKDLAVAIDGICKLQQAFFNRGTQVNIQNNIEAPDFKRFIQP